MDSFDDLEVQRVGAKLRELLEAALEAGYVLRRGEYSDDVEGCLLSTLRNAAGLDLPYHSAAVDILDVNFLQVRILEEGFEGWGYHPQSNPWYRLGASIAREYYLPSNPGAELPEMRLTEAGKRLREQQRSGLQ